MALGGRPPRRTRGSRRVDGDGDFEMSGPGRHGRQDDARGGGRGGGRGVGRGYGLLRGRGIDKHQVSRRVNQNTDLAVGRGPRGYLEGVLARQEQGDHRLNSKRPAPLRRGGGFAKYGGNHKVPSVRLAVTGFKGTKAASNDDGGAGSVSNFLMKKTGGNISKVRWTLRFSRH